MNIKLKLPSDDSATIPFEFSDDSGADFMTIYADDVQEIQDVSVASATTPPNPYPSATILGVEALRLGDGGYYFARVVLLEANLEHPVPEKEQAGESWRDEFLPLEVIIRDGNIHTAGAPRLNGPLLRHHYYTATSNTDMIRLYAMTNVTGGIRFFINKYKQTVHGVKQPITSFVKKLLPPTSIYTLMQNPLGGA